MTTITHELKRAILNKDNFAPPPLVDLALQLDIAPSDFMDWFDAFRERNKIGPWYNLNVAQYAAFLKHLQLEGLLE